MSTEKDTIYDVLVIGGGISGLGVARAAARRGLRCALLEKGVCCRAASDNSLRIIHGGLRYLQQLNFPRTVESLREQDDLLRRHPEHVLPLMCIMPLERFGLKSRLPLMCALQAYRALALAAGVETHDRAQLISAAAAEERAQLLRGRRMPGALLWREGLLQSARSFADLIKRETQEAGAAVFEGVRVTGVARSGAAYEVSTDNGSGAFAARTVVNTAGAWLQRISGPQLFKPLRWCKAFNLVIARRAVEGSAVGAPGGGRLYFAVPREEGTAIGTFYFMYDGDPDAVEVSERELSQAVREVNEAHPALQLGQEEIQTVEAAVLPARGEGARGPQLYGSERVAVEGGYIQVLSTKFTTFQSQAEQVMRRVAQVLEEGRR